MKDGKSLLLLLLAFGMVGTWVYHLYDKNQYSNKINEVIVKDTTGMAEVIRDSLQKLYASAVNEMGDTIDTTHGNLDSLRGQLDSRLSEISGLRNEISRILSNKNLTKDELKEAKSKIRDLHSRVDEMTIENSSLEDQRKKLNGELNQLTEEVKGLQQNISILDSQNNELKKIVYSASTLVASELTLAIIDTKASSGAEMETSRAKRANKVVVSFIAQNTIAQFTNTEVFVVLTDPGGTVITNELWESGNFDTKNENGKTFTRKIKFDYVKGEKKRLVFSLDYDKFIKGTYRIQLYHNKTLIGESAKTLG